MRGLLPSLGALRMWVEAAAAAAKRLDSRLQRTNTLHERHRACMCPTQPRVCTALDFVRSTLHMQGGHV